MGHQSFFSSVRKQVIKEITGVIKEANTFCRKEVSRDHCLAKATGSLGHRIVLMPSVSPSVYGQSAILISLRLFSSMSMLSRLVVVEQACGS